MKNQNRMMTPNEAASRLEVPVATIRQWLRKGSLKGTKLGPRLWRIREKDLLAFIENGWNTPQISENP